MFAYSNSEILTEYTDFNWYCYLTEKYKKKIWKLNQLQNTNTIAQTISQTQMNNLDWNDEQKMELKLKLKAGSKE